MTSAPYTLVLLRHGESDWNAKNLFTGWVDVAAHREGPRRGARGGELLAERRHPARRRPHLAAAPRDHHRAHRARRRRPALDPGPAQLAAQRAPLRRPAGQEQEADPRGVRRGAVHALAPLVRHTAAADRRRRRVLPGRRRRVRRPRRRVLPRTECLKDVVARLLPYWYDAIVPRPARRPDRARRRARQLAARAGQAPRRHQRRGHRRPQHPHRHPAGLRARRATCGRPARGGEYLDPDAAAEAPIEAVANQGR